MPLKNNPVPAALGIFVLALALTTALFWLIRGKTTPAPPPTKIAAKRGSILPPQINNEGAVDISIAALNFDLTAEVWTFAVSLNTHSVELGEDMAKQSFLIVGNGKEESARGWEGDPPGGHHRQGTLKFNKPQAQPQEITIIIKGVAGISERRFVWPLP